MQGQKAEMQYTSVHYEGWFETNPHSVPPHSDTFALLYYHQAIGIGQFVCYT